ncbi:MAG: DNA-3-methyladenine glycosylase I [Planctomycetaceae bacterium]
MTTPEEDLPKGDDNLRRCWWCHGHDDYQQYHDHEWGHPVADDRRLFEKICLEGFQSGLSWLTILRKRENFRDAFCDFDFTQIARFRTRDVERLLKNEGIVRHRGKIEATLNNAVQAVRMADEFGSLAVWFWQYEPDQQSRAPLTSRSDACERSICPEAVAMSKALKKLGWKFVGPTTAYAFMQAMGMVNDHLVGCGHFTTVEKLRRKFRRPKQK